MPRYNLYWSERRTAQIEAESQEEAMLKYEAGDYDSDYVGEHDFRIEKISTINDKGGANV